MNKIGLLFLSALMSVVVFFSVSYGNNEFLRAANDNYVSAYMKYTSAVKAGEDDDTLKKLAEDVDKTQKIWKELIIKYRKKKIKRKIHRKRRKKIFIPSKLVITKPHSRKIIDEFVNEIPIKVDSYGLFDVPTKIIVGKPVQNVPTVLKNKTISTNIKLGIAIENNKVKKDVHIKLNVPKNMNSDKLVVTLYQNKKHIPLEIVNINNKSGDSKNKTIDIKISADIFNNVLTSLNNMKSGILMISNSIKESKKIEKGLYLYKKRWLKITSLSQLDKKKKYVLIIHGIYSTVMEFNKLASILKKHGYGVIGFNYDYNLDIRKNGLILKKKMRQLFNYLNHKIFIVAHSMGGIVARYSIIEGGDKYCDKLVLLSSPNNGVENIYNMQNNDIAHDIPPISYIKKWPEGIKELVRTSKEGKQLFSEINNSNLKIDTSYFGIIHKYDEWVPLKSWGIFRKKNGHEQIKNNLWNLKCGDMFIIDNSVYKNSSDLTDAHSSSHKSIKAIEIICKFLEKGSL